jgi:hypothetical protein
MFKISTFGRKIREGVEIDGVDKLWTIVLRGWISAEASSVLRSTSTSASTATTGLATSSRLSRLASRRLLGIGSMGVYLIGPHIIAIGVSLHSGHHMHLIHLGSSGSDVHHGRATSTHGWGALVLYLIAATWIVRLTTTTTVGSTSIWLMR